jgi:hypothetical protein
MFRGEPKRGRLESMCRNIRTLYNYAPPATSEEVHAAALQYVRKVSGTSKPSAANAPAIQQAVAEVAEVTQRLLDAMVTSAPPKDRGVEAAKARERTVVRFASSARAG